MMSRAIILDENYMKRAAHRRRAAAWVEYMSAYKTTPQGIRRPDPLSEAREAYVSGAINLGDFEAKVSLILRGESVG